MKKLVLTYGLMVIVILSIGAINSSSIDGRQTNGQELVCRTQSFFMAADDFSFDVTPTQKAITLFSDGFPNHSLYINTTPTLHLSPELLASSENGKRAVSRYSSTLKI